MGLEHLNAGFLLHVLYEQSSNDQLNVPYLRSSMDRWWANCIRNEDERLFIGELIASVRAGERTFTRSMYYDLLERRKKTSELSWEDQSEEVSTHETEESQPVEKQDNDVIEQ